MWAGAIPIAFCEESNVLRMTSKAEREEWEIAHVEYTGGGREAVIAAVAHGLRFPEYFGGNWDALDECLSDLSWIRAPGIVLVFHGAERLWREVPRDAAVLLELWLSAARSSERSQERSLHLMFVW